MFKLIVGLFLVVNGVLSEQPISQLTNTIQFDTEKACMEYFSTEAGEKARVAIEDIIEENKGKFAVKYACVQAGAIKEDDRV